MLRQEERKTPLARSEGQLEYQRQIENGLERSVQSLLEPAVGKGKVHVRVSAHLDFQHIERTEKRFDADNPAIRSEQRTKEEGSGPGFWAVGTPGVKTNLGETVAEPQRTNEKTLSSRQSEIINYEISQVESKIVAPSGEIKQLSVAVLVDGTYQPGDKAGEQKYVPRAAEELNKYREIVKRAVGYNETRGDQVEVASVPFQVSDNLEDLAMAKEAQRALWLQFARYGVYAFLGVLLFLGVVRPLLRWITAREETAVVETVLPRTVEELEAGMEGTEMLPAGTAVATAQLPAASSYVRPAGVELRDRVMELARTEPERAVEIIRLWLKKG
jgi:flagellar M-ring protein FliF